LSCVGRGLGAGLIPRPRSPTKCLKGPKSKKENPTPEKGTRNNEEEEEFDMINTKQDTKLIYDFIFRVKNTSFALCMLHSVFDA
jgi:hypothetical protein